MNKDNPIESTYLETIRKYRESAGLPPLELIPNRTPCGAYLISDSSGVRMKAHIRECEECIELLDKADQDEPDQYQDGDGDEAEDHRLDDPRHTPYSQQRPK